ncbi:MAG: hypothetical protein CVU39_18790 [Chloroflexi bacterium HGW-Chloroflexi-10]|nr:MAG: hypothetical protein CVU39_18790 [Chloroflexi bacterium HGW-Chloroflexi-10]
MDLNPTQPYLKTKLQPPPVRRDLVPRLDLYARLEDIPRMPFTLVCAPPGYGKTTSLVEWSRSRTLPVAWLTLDDSENDVVRFFHTLVLAIQVVVPHAGKAAVAALNYLAEDMLEVALRLLVNDLAEMDTALVLVLDDYHVIRNAEIHHILTYLLEHHPPNLHLVIASREEPPINLTRRRARGALLEIRALDLSFNTKEIQTFLNEVMGLKLSQDQVEHLQKHTEGWAAAIQLAGLSLRGGEREATLDGRLAGQHYIFEYLAEEVLDRQPPAVQRFLLATATVERMCGPLCDSLVESFLPGKDGVACLDSLEHANLFVQPLDNEHRWYRYHSLFAEYLRLVLQKNDPERLNFLNRQAAAWYASQGLWDEACKHALAANDLLALAGYLQTSVETLEKRGELSTLAFWLRQLPEETIVQYPHLNLARAWVSFSSLDLDKAAGYLLQVEASAAYHTDRLLKGGVLTARSLFSGLMGDYEQAHRYGTEALNYLPGETHYLYGMLRFNLSFPCFLNNQLDQAVQELEAAVHAALISNTPLVALLALRVLGEAYIMLGHLTQAEQTFLRAGEIVDECIGENSPLMGLSWMGLGEVYRQRNDLERAQALLEAGVSECLTFMPIIAVDGLIWLSQLKQGRGDRLGAQAAMRRVFEIANLNNHPILDDWWSKVALLRLNIQQGHLDEVDRWLAAEGLDANSVESPDEIMPDAPLYIREGSRYVAARFLLAVGRRDQNREAIGKARRMLEEVLPLSEQAGLLGMVMEGLVLLVQSLVLLGEEEAAQTQFVRVLRLGMSERPLRVFLDEETALMEVLSGWQKMPLAPQERAYFEQILAAWQTQNTQLPETPLQSRQLVEPLSRREMEVLRWLAAGKSNKEIAAGLVLSLNTVKRHTAAVMGKLGAKNRTEAVRIGKEHAII